MRRLYNARRKYPNVATMYVHLYITVYSLTTCCLCMAAQSFKEQCLESHNNYRKLHQASSLTWSDELEKDAKAWADFLSANNKFQHGSSGENLYITGSKPSDPCVRATKAFYDEIKDYNFNKPGFSMATGHFTQVVWKSTKKMGAVQMVRKDGALVVVIRYSPPGNYNTWKAFKENVLPIKSGTTTPYGISTVLLASVLLIVVLLNA